MTNDDPRPCRDAFLEWDTPMDSVQAAKFHMTKGFVAAELYEAAWNRRSGEPDVKAVLESLRDKSVFSDEDKVQKLVETLRWYDEEILILKQARDDAESEHTRLRSEVEKVRDEAYGSNRLWIIKALNRILTETEGK